MMNTTSPDDDWNDLARELGVDKSKEPSRPDAAPADMVERQIEAEGFEPHHGTDGRVELEAVAEGEPEADEEADDSAEGAGAEDQPGTGRKRRRRRRRRRKGGAADGVASGEAAEGDEDEAPVAAEEPPAEADDYEPEPSDSEEEEPDAELVPFGAEEDTASEVLRDLIATWNVPSWEDIVDGLHRP